MILVMAHHVAVEGGIPRESGDDPWPVTLSCYPDKYSPRERG